MRKFADTLVQKCIQKNIISDGQAPWLRYILEKQISTACVTIPFLVVGTAISSISSTIVFFLSFCFLRCRTNGFHAQTVCGCLCVSVLLELLFLGVLYHFLSPSIIVITIIISTITIFIFAPFYHPHLEMKEEEYAACKIGSRIRVCLLLIILILINNEQITKCLTLGIAMAAAMLIFANLQVQEENK